MKKPANVLYGVDDTPPGSVTLLTAFQHVAIVSINLIYPVLISREAGGSSKLVTDVVSMALLASGVGAILQALRRGPVGSGFLCPTVPSAVYFVPSLLAARRGGLPLVFGMTMFSGLLEAALSRALRHLRPLFPPEVAGLVITMVGVSAGSLGVRTILLPPPGQDTDPFPVVVAILTLGVMVALNVWARGMLRLFCALIGMVIGYVAATGLGALSSADRALLAGGPLLAVPRPELAWSFDPALVLAFGAAALAATLKAAANITTCQKLNDAEWRRADMGSVSRGVLADGLGSLLGGLLGTMGTNSGSTNVGLCNATGVFSRRIAFATGGLLVALAFFPKLGLLLYMMPPGVAGAALLFSSSFILVNGVEIMTSRLLDARRTIIIGIPFVAGLSVDLHPALVQNVSGVLGAFVGSSLVLGTVSALLLNLVFRLGTRRTQSLVVEPERVDPRAIEEFMERYGAAWGARRDVIDRAAFNLVQAVETIVDGCRFLWNRM